MVQLFALRQELARSWKLNREAALRERLDASDRLLGENVALFHYYQQKCASLEDEMKRMRLDCWNPTQLQVAEKQR